MYKGKGVKAPSPLLNKYKGKSESNEKNNIFIVNISTIG